MTGVSSKLGIIAGGGQLPVRLADNAVAEGREVFILGVKGFVSNELMDRHEGIVLSIGEIGAHIKALKAANVEQLCFAGIVKRPDFKALKLDRKGMSILPRVISAASKGDDSLMRTMMEVFEKEGFQIIGADELQGTLLAPEGAFGKFSPSEDDLLDVAKAAAIASVMGSLDIGQATVCCRGLVLAVEAQEGTDKMLQRCAQLPENIRGTKSSPAGVLLKRPKPIQELRIDLPTIGVTTVEGAAKAGLVGVAVEAGATLVIDKAAVAAAADDLGLWVFGFSKEDYPAENL